MSSALRAHVRFARELRSLLRSPYALIHVETHEEQRAVELIYRLANHDTRPLWEWSAITGFGGEPSGANLMSAFDQIEAGQAGGIFIFKDAQNLLNDSTLRRRLRELERLCAQAGKSLIFIGPEFTPHEELAKDVTRLSFPLPDREIISKELDEVLPEPTFSTLPREVLIQGALGLTLREAHRAFHRVRDQLDDAQQRGAAFDPGESILKEKQRIVGQSDVLEFHPLREGLADVGGLESLKRWLKERKAAFGEEARAFGLPAPKGLLLIGVQGCGKSLTAKVVGRHWGLPLLRLDMGSVFDGKRAPEEALRRALKTCEALAPCVLWMDEIEKGFAASGEEGRSGRVLGSLLTWQQEKTTPVFLVATANRVESLPPELLRKGRFDEVFFIDLPNLHERREILRIHLTRRKRTVDDAIIDEVNGMCEYFSGAELEQVVIGAMYTAFADKRDIERDDLVFAAQETVPLYRTYEEQIKELREWAHGRARSASRQRRVLDFFRDGP